MKQALNHAFQTAYARLNEGQKKAVDTIEGPVVVMAGPGTGKTQVLTLRIANIVRTTDTPPDAILALTYTNSGVRAMRERLKTFIGHDAYRVNIHTFHNYATSVIESHPTYFPRIIGASSADDVELHDIVRTALERVGDPALLPMGDKEYYVQPVLKLIAALKSDRVSVEKYEAYITSVAGEESDEAGEPSTKLVRSSAFVHVFRMYEMILRERNHFDYSDMLVELISALETHEALKLELAESAQYILADEHQDANRSQNRILELLAEAHPDGAVSPNLFIVGDDKQAIYRFQGASLENFLYFRDHYQNVAVIPLTENYRSTRDILLGAGNMMKGRALDESELVSNRGDGTPIEFMVAATSDDEVEAVATRITTLMHANTPPEEVAVLLRANKDIDAFARALKAKGVPFVSLRDSDALASPEITLLIALIRSAVQPHDNDALGKALFLPAFQVSTALLAQVFGEAKRRNTPLFTVLTETAELRHVVAFYERMMKSAHTKPAMDALDMLVTESGFVGELMEAGELTLALAAYRAIRILIETRSNRNERYTLTDALSLLHDLERGVAHVKVSHTEEGHGVRLMTLHKSKGLEFEHVFIPHALESRFKPRADRELFLIPSEVNKPEGDIEDERRLFYVGVTRAKAHLYISAHEKRDTDKEEKPLPFVRDLGTLSETRAEPASVPALPPRAETPAQVRAEYHTLIEGFFASGISATALNAYLSDPWECFFKNVLRIPETQATHQLYGTAIHAALERLYDALKKGATPSEYDFITYFEHALYREPLTARDREMYLKKGREALSVYFAAKEGTFNANALTEVLFAVDLALPKGHERDTVHIRGFLDRVELDGSAAHVTDYKTGRVKSRNEILGKTQSSDGSIYRQLLFYKLLLDVDARYTFAGATVDFVEPNPTGKHKEESFTITNDEKGVLVEQLARMVDDLVRGDFLTKTSASEDAEVRALALLVQKRFSS